VAIQLKIFNSCGTAMIIVAAVKYALVSTSRPTLKHMRLHTKNPRIPIEKLRKPFLDNQRLIS